MTLETKAQVLDYLLSRLPGACEGFTFDYADDDDGVAYLTVNSRDFKITIEEIGK